MRHLPILLLLLGCGDEAPRTSTPAAELSFRKMRLAEFDQGRVKFFAEAASAEGSLGGGLVLEDVHVEHRGVKKSKEVDVGALLIDAKRANIEIANQEIAAVGFEGGVRIVDSHKRVLTTEKARCSFAEQRFTAPGPSALDSPELKVTATAVEGNLETQEFHLSGPIRGTFDPTAARR